MARPRTELRRADDYEDAVRLWRLAAMVSDHLQGLPGPVELVFEDDQHPGLDDIVETFGSAPADLGRTRCWQIKRETDTTDAATLVSAFKALHADESLRAIVAIRDHTVVERIGTLGQLGAFIERASVPECDVDRLERTSYARDRQWVKFVCDAVGSELDWTTALRVLRRLQVETLGPESSIKERAIGRLREVYVKPDAAYGHLAQALPRLRDPAVRVTCAMVEKIVAETSSVRPDLASANLAGLRELRPRLRQYAQHVLTSKAAILVPGQAIVPVSRLVSVRRPSQSTREGVGGSKSHEDMTTTLRTLIGSERLTLLFAELGAGKSTECAKLAEELSTTAGAALPVIVPCAVLPVDKIENAAALLDSCSNFVASDIAPDIQFAGLLELLRQSTKVLLLLDGLDEASRQGAGKILRAAESAVRAFPTLTVLATARPSELHLQPPQGWTAASLRPLERDSRLALLRAVSVAQGENERAAAARARMIESRTTESARLAPLMGTPLTVGMLAETAAPTDTDVSVGELVDRFVKLRLERWSLISGRTDVEARTISVLPDVASRLDVLANLHSAMAAGFISRDLAIDTVEQAVSRYTTAEPRACAEEALRFLVHSGLVTADWDSVRLPIATVGQYLDGYAMAVRMERGQQAESGPDQWRILAFGVAVLRKRGSLPKCRERIGPLIDSLVESGVVPGAAFVVAETKDAALAVRFVEGLKSIGERPLWVFDNEKMESAAAIADALVLAGAEGFWWFYNRYLDPRYPIPHTGSAIVGWIFAPWCMRIGNTLDASQKKALETLLAAITGTQSSHHLWVVPSLVHVIPHAFSPRQTAAHLVDFLWNPRTELLARRKLADLSAHYREEVLAACEAAAAKGFESALSAAELWLSLMPDRLDTRIVDAVLGARPRIESGNATWNAALSTVETRMGAARFERYLRWRLVSTDARAVGAAFALWERGERQVRLLGDAALYGLHGGVNCDGAASMAESVLDGAGGEALGWLSYRFEIERWHGFGAHAGWWRLLLRYIQRAELAVGVDAFSRALRGAYGFVLIRDADLRGEVGHLLLHGDDQPFRAVAIAALKSADVEERLGAAMLLVSCDTDPPFEALVEVLHGFDALLGIHNPWEWEHFLAGRLFPKSVTDRLVAHTTTMQPRARAMALFLAKGRTGEAPDPEIDGQIVRHVLVGDLTMMDPTGTKTSLLSSESGRATLAEEIQAGGQRAATAAENLLRYHRSTLSLVEHARVAVVAARGGYWRVGRIRELLAGMRRDEEFRREVNSQVLDAGPSGTGDLLWLILSNAGSEAWEPALESLFPFGGHDQHSMEEPGLLLLRSELPDGTRRAIGVAAAAVLDRRNDESRTSADGGAWLALLADEHYVERHISLADYVQPLIGHYSNVLPALRARTAGEPSFGPWPGAAPLRPASAYDIPTGNSTILTANSMRSLSDLVSPDGPFENQCMQRLHAVIVADVDGVVTELTKAGAAEERWAAIQGVLEWIDGRAPSIEVLQAGSPALLNGGEGRNGESAANLAQWWWLAQRDALRLDYVLRDRFLEVMSDSVVRRTSDVAGGGALLLSQRGHLLAHEIESVVGAVLDPSNLHVSLVRELCKWVSRGIPGTQRTGAIAAFDAVIARLDASPGHDFVFARGVAPLAVPLLSWALGAEVSEAATRVFVRGVGGLRTSQGPHRETAVTVEVIAPVLPKVDVGIVSRALEFGIRNGALFDRINCFLFAAGLRARVPLN